MAGPSHPPIIHPSSPITHQSILTESLQCLLYKRPMSCHTQYTDVEPPYDTEESFGSDPACMSQMISVARCLPPSLTSPLDFRFKHSFTTESMIPAIHDVLSCTTPPLYSTVMKIDKKIRTSAYPSKLQFVNLREASMELLMQSQEMLFARDICMSPSLVGVAPIRAHTESRQPSSDFTEITSSRRSKSHQRIPRKAMQVTLSRPCTCLCFSTNWPSRG